MAWIELHQTLREHKKMFACADALNLSRIEMIGTLVSLWLWSLDNAQDGSLAGISDKTIARVCDFPEKKAGKLMESLVTHGFIDCEEDHYIIHDWHDYAGKLMERRKKDRERKNTSNGSRKNSSGIPAEQPRNSHATVPIPYHTVPNHNTGGEKKIDSTGGTAPAPLVDGKAFTSFWEAYPWKMNREEAWEAWKTLNPDLDTVIRIMTGLDAWKKSERWTEDSGRFIPAAAKFLRERDAYWGNPPQPAQKKPQQGYVHGADRLAQMLERGDFDD